MKTHPMAIICAAGPDDRWRGHLGVPRFLAPVHTGPLVQRTVDQLRGRGIADVLVTASDPRLRGLRDCRVVPTKVAAPCPGFGASTSIPLWVPGRDVVVLHGDTYYSDAGLDTILAGNKNFCWWYGRTGGGGLAKDHYEMFAVTIPAGFHGEFRAACEKACQARWDGSGATISAFLVYRILNGLQVAAARLVGPSWTELNDETEDLDCPEDYDAWVRLYPDLAPPGPKEEPPARQSPAEEDWGKVAEPAPAAEVDMSGVPAEPGGSLEEEARKQQDDGGQPPEEDTEGGEG